MKRHRLLTPSLKAALANVDDLSPSIGALAAVVLDESATRSERVLAARFGAQTAQTVASELRYIEQALATEEIGS